MPFCPNELSALISFSPISQCASNTSLPVAGSINQVTRHGQAGEFLQLLQSHALVTCQTDFTLKGTYEINHDFGCRGWLTRRACNSTATTTLYRHRPRHVRRGRDE